MGTCRGQSTGKEYLVIMKRWTLSIIIALRAVPFRMVPIHLVSNGRIGDARRRVIFDVSQVT
jgi:hypothetical protein